MLLEKPSRLESLQVMKTSSGCSHLCVTHTALGQGLAAMGTLVFHSGCCHGGTCKVSFQML